MSGDLSQHALQYNKFSFARGNIYAPHSTEIAQKTAFKYHVIDEYMKPCVILVGIIQSHFEEICQRKLLAQ